MNDLLERLKLLLPKSRFARNVMVLAGGTAFGQGILILASPVLTRLYSPEDFGVLGVYSSALAILGVFANLRLELAIPLPEERNVAANLLAASLCSVLVVSGLLVIVLVLFGSSVLRALNILVLSPYLWLIPCGVLLIGVYQALNYWAIREQAFKSVAQTKLNQSLSSLATQLGLGFFQVTPLGLLLGQVSGQSAGVLTLGRLIETADIQAVSPVGMRQALVRYRRFPLFTLWTGLLNALSVNLAILLLAGLFSQTTAGLYVFATRILKTPLSLVGTAIGQVFFSDAAAATRRGTLDTETKNVFSKLVSIGLPSIALICLLAPEAFALVFGEDYREAGRYAQWLSPWLLLVFISSPLSTLPSVLEKQGAELLFQVILLAARVAALVVAGFFNDGALAVGLYGVVSAVIWFGFTVWNMAISGNSPRVTVSILGTELLLTSLFLSPVAVLGYFAPESLWIFVALLVGVSLSAYRMGWQVKRIS